MLCKVGEFHAHCIGAQNAYLVLFLKYVIYEKKTLLAKLIAKKTKKQKNQNNRFNKTWLSVKLLGIAEASTLLSII